MAFPNILLRNPSLLCRTFLKLSTAFVERSHHSDLLASTTDETEKLLFTEFLLIHFCIIFNEDSPYLC